MAVFTEIEILAKQVLRDLYGETADRLDILINETKPEFEGDYTIVTFATAKALKRAPDSLAKELGTQMLRDHGQFFSSFNVVKGFLNLTISDAIWLDFLDKNFDSEHFTGKQSNGKTVMVEYSSPNTNKPLHLGHLRNIFLGWSVAEIFKACGFRVIKTCIANDRGIHICKSMVGWQQYAHGATPASKGIKGDHFVGDYYVLFNQEFSKQVEALVDSGMNREEAEQQAPLIKTAQNMLVEWEQGNPDVLNLWSAMNAWVYAGFEETYKRLGTDFDKIYYESQTYILGKKLVAHGLDRKIFFHKDDGSVWIDLTKEGLDEKIVQRKDGTAVYITQDIGLAQEKYEEFRPELSIYVVGDEQNYHFKVLKQICMKLAIPSAENIFHLSYGMVELPTGRMKTREGSVVDADDLLDEMHSEAQQKTSEQGKTAGFSDQELDELYETIGVGGLKFFLLRVDPKKKMLFNPEESIDLHGYTATFIQYAHARIKSILRKESQRHGNTQANGISLVKAKASLLPLEKKLVVLAEKYPLIITQACEEMNPSVVANFVYNVAKAFNSFYAEHSVSGAESEEKNLLRFRLCLLTAIVIKASMSLLGIKVPEKM